MDESFTCLSITLFSFSCMRVTSIISLLRREECLLTIFVSLKSGHQLGQAFKCTFKVISVASGSIILKLYRTIKVHMLWYSSCGLPKSTILRRLWSQKSIVNGQGDNNPEFKSAEVLTTQRELHAWTSKACVQCH